MALLALASGSCGRDEPVVPSVARRLIGEWVSAPDSVGGTGVWQRTLSIGADGHVVHRGVSYGLYPGQRATDVSSEVVSYGRLGASATAFVLRVDSIVSTDAFSGTAQRTVQRGVPNAPGDSTRYTVRGDVLDLTYVTAPADVPMVVSDRLVRRR